MRTPPPIEGPTYLARGGVDSGRGARLPGEHYSTFRSAREGGGEEKRVIDKKSGVYYPATAEEEGVTSRRDAVGMFSQRERRSPVAIVATAPLSPARGMHSYPPAIGVIYSRDNRA